MPTAPSSASKFDAIIIGSGMGSMTTATALSHMGHRVLLLEQAQAIGGLTHTFSRQGFTWDVGILPTRRRRTHDERGTPISANNRMDLKKFAALHEEIDRCS